jgi:hypothetical protein
VHDARHSFEVARRCDQKKITPAREQSSGSTGDVAGDAAALVAAQRDL